MQVLVTGATGYVGGRLVPLLLEAGHEVHALVRNPGRLEGRPWSEDVIVHQADVLADDLGQLPAFDAAYYLIHGMGSGDFEASDARAAHNFCAVKTEHCIYLGGLQPAGQPRPHLRSRAEVGAILAACHATTEFRAGPIIGSGSTSFEMARYLTERLPVMVAPKWVDNRIRPIGIRDVLAYLLAALTTGPQGIIDIGADPVTFRQMMQGYAEVRGLRSRVIAAVPVLAPRLAARWVQFVTPVPNTLAIPIIDGIRDDLVGDTTKAAELYPGIQPMPYREAVALALQRTQEDAVETRWSSAGGATYELEDRANVLREVRTIRIDAPPDVVFRFLTTLGGEQGWLTWRWAWRLRGALDRAVGGPGLRRGRRTRAGVRPGDTVDFWRVEAVEVPRLLRLRAEMKLPGKAWLQFQVAPDGAGSRLVQTALFEPRGAPGILYWKALYPVHRLLFRDLARAIAREVT